MQSGRLALLKTPKASSFHRNISIGLKMTNSSKLTQLIGLVLNQK